jgi:hypothetical protein
LTECRSLRTIEIPQLNDEKVYAKFIEKIVLKMEEAPDLRSHPLTVIMQSSVNIKTAFKFMELE